MKLATTAITIFQIFFRSFLRHLVWRSSNRAKYFPQDNTAWKSARVGTGNKEQGVHFRFLSSSSVGFFDFDYCDLKFEDYNLNFDERILNFYVHHFNYVYWFFAKWSCNCVFRFLSDISVLHRTKNYLVFSRLAAKKRNVSTADIVAVESPSTFPPLPFSSPSPRACYTGHLDTYSWGHQSEAWYLLMHDVIIKRLDTISS